jgi:hypothetical protein
MNLDASCAQIQRLVSTLVKAHKIYTPVGRNMKKIQKQKEQPGVLHEETPGRKTCWGGAKL